MKRQLLVYYISLAIYFILITLSRSWLDVAFVPLWIGGLIGAILPDVDHFIYVYFLRPHELTSQRAAHLMSQGKIVQTFSLLANTRSERTHLVFHTAMFQLIFYAFTFFVLSSSHNLLGRGIVLAFLLHLLVDQFLDFKQLGSISHWFKGTDLKLDHNKTVFYWAAAGLVLVVYGFLL